MSNVAIEEAPSLLEIRAMSFLRATMVVIFLIFGVHKFTLIEAQGIAPIVTNSPLTSWLNVLGMQGASMVIGVFELLFGAMLTVGFWRPGSIVAALGAVGSVICFLTTLSFLATTPGVFAPGHAPILGIMGGFLIKDIVLLAASFVLLAQSITLLKRSRAREKVA